MHYVWYVKYDSQFVYAAYLYMSVLECKEIYIRGALCWVVKEPKHSILQGIFLNVYMLSATEVECSFEWRNGSL